jgi:S-DNA-T family DNA segregation ATPase FtsK/SpoIIIE
LRSFGIKARVAEVNPGPTVTQYALEVAVGTNISEIVKKSSNLALALASTTGTVRIEAPIPGRSLVGIEIPNRKAELVTIKRLLQSKVFRENNDPLLVPLGLDVAGEALAVSLDRMPHVLIAGTTGSGKSVMVNAWITTMLFRAKPSDLRLVLVDPKQVELTGYNGIPHLLTEVITDPSKVVNALRWAVAEMETRYKMLRHAGVKNIQGYNQIPNIEKKPYVVFIIDEGNEPPRRI